MKKRGVTQVDWAISLALFLLYVAWFFIFINPMFLEDNTQEALLSIVEDNFKDGYRWEVRKIPLIIYTNTTNSYLPIVEEFNYNWTLSNTKLANNKEFLLDNGKIIFLADVNAQTKYLWLMNSNENYTMKTNTIDLNANETTATTGNNLKVEFVNGLYNTIYYKNKERLNNTKIYIEDDLIERENNQSIINKTIATYRIQTQAFNHTTYIFAKNSLLWNIIKSNMNETYSVKLNFVLYDYEHYYASNQYYGSINYTIPACKQFNNNYLNFYNGDSISFIFNNTASIRFCYENDEINLNITFSIRNESFYKIYLHENNFSNISIKEYDIKFGAIEREKGLNLEKINNLNYQDLKNSWNYPSNKDFKITIWNITSADLINRSTSIADIGRSPNVEDVSVKEWDDYVLTKEAELYPALINVKTW